MFPLAGERSRYLPSLRPSALLTSRSTLCICQIGLAQTETDKLLRGGEGQNNQKAANPRKTQTQFESCLRIKLASVSLQPRLAAMC